jgi:DNA mismatch repair protein MSH6
MTDAKKNMYNLVDEVKDGPWFTQPEYMRDGEGRRPDDPNYDPTTLEIPEQDFKNMTPGMQRYWEIKSKNYDKIVLYRWGEWFILYYQDASTASKILDLCIPPR